MSKKHDQLKSRVKELEANTYKLERTINVMQNTYEDRFNKLLGVLKGEGKMTSFSDYQTISLSEALGLDNGL